METKLGVRARIKARESPKAKTVVVEASREAYAEKKQRKGKDKGYMQKRQA